MNKVLFEAYNNMIEDLSDFSFLIETGRNESAHPVSQIERTSPEGGSLTRKLYTKVLQKGLTVILELQEQEFAGKAERQ